MTLDEVAAEIGMSREWVRLTEIRALAKLRAALCTDLPPEPEDPRAVLLREAEEADAARRARAAESRHDRRARKLSAARAWHQAQPVVAALEAEG